MGSVALVIAGVLAGIVLAVGVRRAIRVIARRGLMRQFMSGDPGMAYHLMTGEQLASFLHELAPGVARLLRRSDLDALARVMRERSAFQVSTMTSATTEPDALVAFLAANGGLELLDCSTAAEALELLTSNARDGAARTLAPAPSVEYHPAQPPSGPVSFVPMYAPLGAVICHWPAFYAKRWRGHLAIIDAIVTAAEAHVVVVDELWLRVASRMIATAGIDLARVRFIVARYDDMWARDCGPTFIDANGESAIVANPYLPNGLGFHKLDQELPVELARHYRLPAYRLPLHLEGGHVVSAGGGVAFTTTHLFELNPDVDERRLRQIFEQYFGVDRLLIVPPLPGELTGHVDASLMAIDETTILVGEAPGSHAWHDALEEAARQAKQAGFTVARAPMPVPNVPAINEWSHLNTLLVNGTFVMPSYDAAADDAAADAIDAVSPGATIIRVDSRDLPVGSVHCLTKEVPRGAMTRLELSPS